MNCHLTYSKHDDSDLLVKVLKELNNKKYKVTLHTYRECIASVLRHNANVVIGIEHIEKYVEGLPNV